MRLLNLLKRKVNPALVIERLENTTDHVCKEDDDRYWTLLPGQSSGSTGESKFECKQCGKTMFRGGWGSANWLEKET